ncbi:MAG: transposase [Desulfobacterales bacterium]|nr:MAG: transposase [Desulfobacterales bacterium]
MPKSPRIRKDLNADALFKALHDDFSKLPDWRQGDIGISMADALMSGFAMFSLKDPSLLAFDERRQYDSNLRTIYRIQSVPCDTQMRKILDPVDPEQLRPGFKGPIRQMQRGKVLERMVFFERCYLLSLDGTGFFSSKKLHSDACLKKVNSKTGEVTYSLQMLGAAIVHPDFKEVIPLTPEFIVKQDGQTKNDCERNAAKRFFGKLRQDHPHLPFIITEDAISSNAPHIREAQKYNLHYILGVKEGDHCFLFEQVKMARSKGHMTEFEIVDEKSPETVHRFSFLNQVPLNESNQDLLVNFLEYWEVTTDKVRHFSWVTDFMVTKDNAYQVMLGGHTRWKIENETFNTLKNQGYHFGHNYGLGKKNLSLVFAMLMMLAFLVDQTQQLSCKLYRAVWTKLKSKRALWERMRSLFKEFAFESMQMLYEAILYGIKVQPPIILYDTS